MVVCIFLIIIMKNNIDNKNLGKSDDKFLDWLNSKELAAKFDKQIDELKKISQKEIHEDGDNPDEILKKIDDFFEQEKKEFNNIDTKKEELVVNNYKNISDRNINIQQAIKDSWNSILMEIKNWEIEKNLVSKVLLKISSWILNSEK